MPVRWGVLGAARIARKQVVPAIGRSHSGEVVAVSSASGKARAFADDLGIPRAYDSHDDLLADGDVDAVYIALPNAAHAQWTISAAEAGKHVLCEKPLVLGVAELEQVQQARDAAGVQVVEAFMYRHHPQLATVRRLIDEGAIGDFVTLQARLHFWLERSADPDIRLRADMGGGSLLDLGCYPVDLFGLLLGREPDDVAAVAHRESPGGVDTRLAAVLRYGEVTASLDCSFDSPFRNTAIFIGTIAAITLTDVFRADRLDGVGTVIVERDDVRDVLEVPGDQYAEEVRAFVRRVTTGTDGAEEDALTARTARTLERIVRAARQS